MPYESLAGVHLGDEELYAAIPNWLVSRDGRATDRPHPDRRNAAKFAVNARWLAAEAEANRANLNFRSRR